MIVPMITEENAIEAVDRFIKSELPKIDYPGFDGRGIVMVAGGTRYQIGAWVTINRLRALGCELPIEVWYLGLREYNAAWERLVAPLGVTCIDAHEVRTRHPHARLAGWEAKPYAITHSQFTEVLYIDADNVPVRDPTYLFDQATHGAMFWPDYGRLAKSRDCWRLFGLVEYRDEPEVESGQMVIDKSKCWEALQLVHWYMQNSTNFYFRHVHGDKEVFHLAWRKLGQRYTMPERGIHSLPGTMCQHDLDGERVFQHRNMRKWRLFTNERVPGFMHESECIELIAELARTWSPAAHSIASSDDRRQMDQMDNRRFQYVRIGHGPGRAIVFNGRGSFDEGGDGRERYWTIRDGRLLIAGDDGRLTMDLEPRPHGGWEGRWLLYERMPIVIYRI